MAKPQIAPKADQPRTTTGDIARKSETPILQYRVQGIQSYNRKQPRSDGRSVRG